MIVSSIIFISLGKLSLIWFLMYIIIVIVNYYNMRNKDSYGSKEDIKKSILVAQIYLDQYYITNKYYTFIITFLYIFGISMIFIFIRYLSLGNIMLIQSVTNINNYILAGVTLYILVIITILLYRSLLVVLFKKEINKFYIYLRQFSLLYKFDAIMEHKIISHIIGVLYLLTYRLGTLTYRYPPYTFTEEDHIYYDSDDNEKAYCLLDIDPNYVIRNKVIISWIYKILDICKKHYSIQRFFRLLSYMLRYIYKHIYNLYYPLPYFLLLCVFLIELYNKEFYYLYYVLFIKIIIKTKRDIEIYIYKRDRSTDRLLSEYFYKNTLNYEKQRIYFYNKDNIEIVQYNKSEQNKTIIYRLNTIIDISFDNFQSPYAGDPLNQNKIKGMYRRFWIIIGYLCINYFIVIMNVKLGLIFLFITCVSIYLHYYTYYLPKNVPYQEILGIEKNHYKYNKRYNIAFWVIIIIQGYIYWLILLKPELTFMNTNILINILDNCIEVVKIYSIENKVMYLHQYFEYYIAHTNLDISHLDYMRHILRNIDHNILINETITLKDLQVYIRLFVDNYQYNELMDTVFKKYIVKINTPYDPLYVLVRNSLFIGGVMLTLSRLHFLWLIGKDMGISYNKINTMKNAYTEGKYSDIRLTDVAGILLKIKYKLW